MTCSQCGVLSPERAKFCPECGFPLRPPTASLPESATLLPENLTYLPESSAFGRPVPDPARPAATLSREDVLTLGLPGSGTHPLSRPFPAPSSIDVTMGTAGVSTPPSPSPAIEHGPLAIGEQFGRYVIIRLLGLGGMGAVYQAWDEELEVAVALKVIRPEVSADSTAAQELERRFKRELLLARQVTHRNVVRIHDLGERGGIKYITMSYVRGKDLSSVAAAEGRLPVPRVLKILRSVVSGLVAAHDAGVVHRDLKPENIMLEEKSDEPLIMDFGIARSASVPSSASKTADRGNAGWRAPSALTNATMAGSVVGTLGYMAPEQAKAQDVDQRADIYSLGLICYDLLLGKKRLEGVASPLDELQQRLDAAPPTLRSIDQAIPQAVDDLVMRCLQPDPAARFHTSAELAAALARLDEDGIPLPEAVGVTKRLAALGAAAIVLMMVGMFGVNSWLVKSRTPPPAHPPVTVLIADFNNATGDPAFDHVLEPMLRMGLEGASFINAYDRSRVRNAFGIKPPEKLDESAARQVAMKHGVGVVLAGSIARAGSGYDLSIKAIQPISANVTTQATRRAATRDEVLANVTKLAVSVRKALGEKTSEADQLFAMRSISRGSLDAISQYAAGIQLQSKGKYEEAIAKFRKAVQADPEFGPGYNSLAVNLRNIGKVEEAGTYAKEALRHLDSMTDRERLSTRGNFYRLSGDLQQCIKEYGELIARYPADTVARNNRAYCLARARDYSRSVGELQQALQILPNHMTYRGNLALYTAYGGDFAAAEREVAAIKEPTPDAMQPLPLSLLAQGRVEEAAATYQKIATMGGFGTTFAASGLADLAVYEGRFSEAVAIYQRGAEADIKDDSPDYAAQKLAALAHAQLSRGQARAAIAAARRALSLSKGVSVKFLAARVLVEAGALDEAQRIASALAAEVATEPQAYGKIVEGEIALKRRNLPEAIKILGEANAVLDTWVGHFDLGRAYLEAGAFAQADSEFDRCLGRRGEALMLVDEDPTYGYFPPVYYYLGRAREGLQTAGYADLYREYLKIRGKSTEDPLVRDARRRAGL